MSKADNLRDENEPEKIVMKPYSYPALGGQRYQIGLAGDIRLTSTPPDVADVGSTTKTGK